MGGDISLISQYWVIGYEYFSSGKDFGEDDSRIWLNFLLSAGFASFFNLFDWEDTFDISSKKPGGEISSRGQYEGLLFSGVKESDNDDEYVLLRFVVFALGWTSSSITMGFSGVVVEYFRRFELVKFSNWNCFESCLGWILCLPNLNSLSIFHVVVSLLFII